MIGTDQIKVSTDKLRVVSKVLTFFPSERRAGLEKVCIYDGASEILLHFNRKANQKTALDIKSGTFLVSYVNVAQENPKCPMHSFMLKVGF